MSECEEVVVYEEMRFKRQVHQLSDGASALPTLTTHDPDTNEDTTVNVLAIGSGSIGAADAFIGGNDAWGYSAHGDAETMQGNAKGGNDIFLGGDNVGSLGGFGGPSMSADMFLPIPGVQFAGDAQDMMGTSLGGKDMMLGGTNSINQFFGDASGTMSEESRGGADNILGGKTAAGECDSAFSLSLLVGDAFDMTDAALGGKDSLVGGEVTAAGSDGYAIGVTAMVGDGIVMGGLSIGGNDTLLGSNALATDGADAYAINAMAGDAAMIGGQATAGNDIMRGGDAVGDSDSCGYALTLNVMLGDSLLLEGGYRSKIVEEEEEHEEVEAVLTLGNDTMVGGSGFGNGYAFNVLVGDTGLSSGEFGGFLGGFGGIGHLGGIGEFGIAGFLSKPEASRSHDHFNGQLYGNDTIVGGFGQAFNVLVGDAGAMGWGDVGGADTITGGGDTTSNIIIGDGYAMAYGSTGGDDVLTGGDGCDDMVYGDAYMMEWNAHGGDDLLIAGANGSTLVGDANSMEWNAEGGNDTLVSGAGDDTMYGDAMCMNGEGGSDLFVFSTGNGNDTVNDFDTCMDTIDLSAFGFESLGQLWCEGRIEQTCDGVLLHLGASYGHEIEFSIAEYVCETETVMLMGVDACDLGGGNFVFATVLEPVVS